MAGELFDAEKWREEQRDKNIMDTVTALASLLTILLANEISEQIRREAFREAAEALRARAKPDDGDWFDQIPEWDDAADHIERTFLSPDNPEGNA